MNNNGTLQDSLKAIEKSTKKIKTLINSIIDEDSFVETDVFTAGKTFLDGSLALGEGVVTGYATFMNTPVHLFAQNQEVMKGSFGKAHATKISKVIKKAVNSGTPLISIIDSSGARVGEGVEMLEAYAELIAMADMVKSQVQHICIIKGACVGMMAAFASMADFVFVSKDAVVSVAPPLSVAAKQADYPKMTSLLGYEAHSAKNDFADFTYTSKADLLDKLKSVFALISSDATESTDEPNRETASLDSVYNVESALGAIADNSKYLEANAGFATELKTCYATINGISVGILAFDSTKNDGYISSRGIEKATNFIDKCGNNGLPLVSLVDCIGIRPCLQAEQNGLAIKLAKLVSAIANHSSSKISVITGKAIGVAYSVFASKGIGFDYSLACTTAQISPITADAAVNIVYSEELKNGESREALANKYNELMANPLISAKDGFIDNVIEPSALRPYIASALIMLLGI